MGGEMFNRFCIYCNQKITKENKSPYERECKPCYIINLTEKIINDMLQEQKNNNRIKDILEGKESGYIVGEAGISKVLVGKANNKYYQVVLDFYSFN